MSLIADQIAAEQKPRFSIDIFKKIVKNIGKYYEVQIDENWSEVNVLYNKKVLTPRNSGQWLHHQKLFNFLTFFGSQYVLIDARSKKEYLSNFYP